jgi:hypothetical protein
MSEHEAQMGQVQPPGMMMARGTSERGAGERLLCKDPGSVTKGGERLADGCARSKGAGKGDK